MHREPWLILSRLSLVGLFVLALLVCLSLGQYVMAPVVAGLLVGLTLSPAARRLERVGLNAYAASGAIVTAIIGTLFVLFAFLAVPFEEWTGRVPEVTSKLAALWDQLRAPMEQIKEIEKQVDAATGGDGNPERVVVGSKGVVTDAITSVPDVVARLLLFGGTLFFFLATRDRLARGLVAFGTTVGNRLVIARAMRDIEVHLSRYVLSISAINAGLGIAVGLVMYALDVPSPELWGALAFALNFAPFVGPALLTIILLGVGFITFDSAGAIVLVPAAYVALNVTESQFVTPAILGRTLTLNPLIVFLAIAFWLWMWGVIGAFIAVPLLAIIWIGICHAFPWVRGQPASVLEAK